jgi:serine/threonine protein kinase
LDSRQGLQNNTVLDGSYRIERVIGSGGFGVTYQAEDVKLRTAVALKEYYPVDFGARDPTMVVRPRSDRHKKTFEWGRTSFLQEAQMLARFRHPSIVRVTRVFEANSTAYMVMDFEQGQSFEAWLKGLGRPPTQAELDRIAAPLLDALETMHAASFLHRDIAPDNIVIRPDGTPVLLDFGAARRAVAEMSRALTGIVKAGYSPHEQYAADGRMQGPWTDLYALAATFYRAISGKAPEEATLRLTDDRMRPAAEVGKDLYRPGFLAALDACLAVVQSKRPQSVAELRPLLLGQGPQAASGTRRIERVLRPILANGLAAPRAGRWLGIAAAALVLLGGLYGGLEYAHRQSQGAFDADAKRAADAEARRKADADAVQRQAALDAEMRRREEERARQAAIEEARRKEEAARRDAETREAERREADAQEAARRKAEAEAEARRRAEQEANAAKKRIEEEAATKGPAQAVDPIRVAAPSSWNKDCASDPIPQVTVVAAPKHGKIEFQEGITKVRKILKGDPKCVGTDQRARVVNYVPSGPPVESDQVALSVLNVRGQRYVIDCTIRVIERKSECRPRR